MIVKMSKITLLGMEDQRKALINSLMEMGAVDICAVDEKEYEELAHNPVMQDEMSGVEGNIAEVNTALESLERHCPEKKGLFQSRRELTLSDFNQVMEIKDNVWKTVGIIKEYEGQLVQLKSEENKLSNLQASLLPWKELPIPLQVTGSQKTTVQMGTISSAAGWEQLETDLYEKAACSYINLVNSDKDQYYAYIIYHTDTEQECLTYLKSRGFNKITFSGLNGTVSENLNTIELRLQELSSDKENVIKNIKSLKDSRKNIEVLYDALGMDHERISAMRKILRTKKVFLIKGWIPEKLAAGSKEWLESKYNVAVDIQEPDDEEEFPVLLENKGIAEAVEPVTSMYSLPNSREIDPNFIMAPFFILFFGLMLSDGGYGLVMALLSGFILFRYKLEDGTRKFMKLMLYCGISTMFWGAMFGGWFGISFFVQYAVWFDMVSEPELMLSWSLLFGIVHMFVGLGVKAANSIRRKKYLDALFDVGSRYITFTGFALYVLPYLPTVDKAKAAPLVNLGQYLLIAGVILLILTQGRGNKNIFGKLFGGIGSMYDIVSFLSDVLSYSRLLALGLATSIIASIVNQMAVMFDLPLPAKVIMALAILIVGHLINFAINALGAYVHSCRLQFLEFFGKFYQGGGEAFNPLKANTKFIILKNN